MFNIHSKSRTDLGLLFIRVALGIIFIAHGFGKFGNISGTTEFFAFWGIPLPELSAYLVSTVELVGGLFLILGLWVHLAGVLLACVMLVAILTAKAGKGFSSYEYEFVLLLVSVGLALSGSGKYALFRKKSQPEIVSGN